jgi:type IX secretion system PorP/SprF family membrane protein
MKKYIYILAALISSCSLQSEAQQSPLMSHYMFNGLLLNPAYAGSKEFVSTTLLYRKQWVGMEGAPVTYSASAHGLLPKKKLGIGGYVQQDKIGVTSQTDAYASLSYHQQLGKGTLAGGMQIGLTNFSSEVVKLTYWDPGDKVFDYNTFSNLLPNAGVGLYYYQELFYAGISAPFVISYDKNRSASLEPSVPVHNMSRRYYITSGGVIETEREIKIKPSFLVRLEPGSDLQYDLNLNVLINDLFWVGASYRSTEAIVALFEYQISRKFRFGYSYDYTLGSLGRYNSGSHELMLGFDFGYPVLKMKSPRYF